MDKQRERLVPTRDDYLGLLNDRQVSESDVAPMVDIQRLDAGALAEMAGADPGDQLALALFLLQGAQKNTNELLQSLVGAMRRMAPTMSARVSGDTFHGVYPTWTLNAECAAVSDGYMVLVNSGAMELIETVATYLNVTSWSDDHIVEQIAVACEMALYRGRIVSPMDSDANDCISDDDRVNAIALTSATQRFLIAHEWGHIAKDHLGGAPSTALHEGSIDVLLKNQMQELEADLWATTLLIGWCLQEDDWFGQIQMAGIYLFLMLAEISQKYAVRARIDLGNVHPNIETRKGILKQFAEVVGATPLFAVAEIIDQTMERVVREIGG
jgi:hypothetical protein